MKNFAKKAVAVFARMIVACCALLFVLLILLQLILVIGVNFAGSGGASAFLAKKINTELADSGYSLAFSRLYYDPIRGFILHDLSVVDAEGEFLTLDRLAVSVSFALSPLRTLDLSAQGGTLDIKRAPVTADSADQQPLTPFSMPDIYFRTINVQKIAFDHINLSPELAGTPYSFSPALKAHITLQETLNMRAQLAPGTADIAPGLPAPEKIELDAMFNPQNLTLALDRLSAKSAVYALETKGSVNLSPGGTLDLAASARMTSLSALTQDSLTAASAQAKISGALAAPALDLTATLAVGSLKERGLDDINLSVKSDDVTQGTTGQVRIDTRFHDEPVTLQAALTYAESKLQIANLKGTAPALALSGDGVYTTENGMIDGKISLTADDLARYSTLLDTKISGKATAQAAFKPANGLQSADIAATVTNGAYENISAGKISAQATLPSITTPWPAAAKVDVTNIKIATDAALDRLSIAVTAAGDSQYKTTIKGNSTQPIAVSFDGSALMSDLTQDVPRLRDINFTARHDGATAKLTGDFSQEKVDLKISTAGLTARHIPTNLPDDLNGMKVNLDAAMTGSPAQPNSTATLSLSGIGSGAYRDASAQITATHDGKTVTTQVSGKGTGIRKLMAEASFPAELSLIPFHFAVDTESSLKGTIDTDIDLAAIAPLVLSPAQSLKGTLTTNGTISGTLASPAPSGTFRLSDAQFEDSATGILFADLSADGSLSREGMKLNNLSGTDGKDGKLGGNGNLSFNDGAANITLKLSDFSAPRSDLANGTIDADLALKGSPDGLLLSGKMRIEKMEIVIPEKFSSSIPQLNIVTDETKKESPLLERLTLDIGINAENQVFVRGWGLDAEFEGDITITGTANRPLFNGAFTSRRGRFEEFGKRFTLSRANLRFQGEIPPSPYLDIEATTPAGDVTGAILLTGSAQAPKISFSSTPALPEDEVLSRILFGKESAKISPFQAVQLAQTLQRFSGKGGASVDPVGMLRAATGLDDISIETDETGAASVGAGKYLTDKVYLELSKGKAEDSGAATIQIEVSPSINIESRIGQDAQSGGGIFWKKDY